jgi:hypothetical protein
MSLPTEASFEFLCEVLPLPEELIDIITSMCELDLNEYKLSAGDRNFMKAVGHLVPSKYVYHNEDWRAFVEMRWHDGYGTTYALHGYYDDGGGDEFSASIYIRSRDGVCTTIGVPMYEKFPLWEAARNDRGVELYPNGILVLTDNGCYRVG